MKTSRSSMFDPMCDSVLDSIYEAIVSVTGSSLIGLYLVGSLATGDFEPHVSDIDLIVVLQEVPNERLVARLGRMHAELAQSRPDWGGRIDVKYISAGGLLNCRHGTTSIAVISPGKPFHVVQAGRDWILDWYLARQIGVRLVGPPIDAVIPSIPSTEYIYEVHRYLLGFTDQLDDDVPSGSQAHAILSICRGLYTIELGQVVSKREAAEWAHQEFPQWADLIDRALAWRRRQWDPDHRAATATVPQTRAFVHSMLRTISAS